MASLAAHEFQLREWLREHRGILVKVARSFASETADQADLVQEMAVQLWQSLPRFRGEAKPTTWIYRTCLNTALVWQRRSRPRRLDIALEHLPELGNDARAQRRAEETNDLLAQVYERIRGLPPADRSLLILYLDGLSYREISDITGATENHVGVALNRVRKKLADHLEEVRREL